MSPFKGFPHSDFVVVSPEGEIRGKGSGIFSGKHVIVFDEKLTVFVDDEIRRTLPNGSDETFTVVDPKFFGRIATVPAHFQIEVRRKGSFPHHKGGYFNISVSGENSRVSIGSTDNSTNVVNNSGVFADLINAIEGGVTDTSQKAALIGAVRDMEEAKGTNRFASAYQKFVGLTADHIGVVSPFLPLLGGYFAG